MRRTTTVVLGLLSAALLAACGQTDSPTPAAPTYDPGLAHVHGLGVDPADGTLYAASHYGLFRVPGNGKPERVGTLQQDTMGFTVVGPNHFLGSGHPDPADKSAPKHLGLIESTDAGRSWTSLSLAGQADFHALEAKHGSVYGYDSQTGRLAVTADRRTWDRRAQVDLADFAVSPSNPDVLLATTRQGVTRSTDGGRTFTPIAGAPVLQLVDWPEDAVVVGVAPDGTVQTSADGGATWTRQGTVRGRPGALATHGRTEVFLATESAIHRSSDGGRTFTRTQSLG
ncbi:F510_1955 family glycosylhydrolase [Actinosynnema sp. CA-248983]